MLPVFDADPLQMHQLLQNLIGNALKYHRPEETPVVKIYHKPCPDPESFCCIAVQDNGIGFDTRDADRMFGLFQRLHKDTGYEGTGIGLTISKRIVERHQGTISVESTPGQGSTFIIILPVKQSGNGAGPC